MFNSKVIKSQRFTSKKTGKPCVIVWYKSDSELPVKNFGDASVDYKAGDTIKVSIEPGYDCTGRIVIEKA